MGFETLGLGDYFNHKQPWFLFMGGGLWDQNLEKRLVWPD